MFEYIYFARPDSVLDGRSVHACRRRAGEILAEELPVEADVVIGVPDSGMDAAIGYSERSGIPYEIGFIKNKYIGRTFISPGQSARTDGVKIKLNPISGVVHGKRVILVDGAAVFAPVLLWNGYRFQRRVDCQPLHIGGSSQPYRG